MMKIDDAGTWFDMNGDEIQLGDVLECVETAFDGGLTIPSQRKNVLVEFDKKIGVLRAFPIGNINNSRCRLSQLNLKYFRIKRKKI